MLVFSSVFVAGMSDWPPAINPFFAPFFSKRVSSFSESIHIGQESRGIMLILKYDVTEYEELFAVL